jgi:long-subunit acyl-CoA synthetase (AMP-forming)
MPKPGAGMPPEVKAIVGGVPSTDAIRDEVVQILGLEKRSKSSLARDLDIVLQLMMDEGLVALRRHQAVVTRKLIRLYADVEAGDPDRALMLIEKGFTSLGNQRKKRAGVHMEKSVKWLLDRCSIANEEAPVISGQSDLVVPSAKVLLERSERAVVLEFKTTTRERWKEVRDEIARTGLKVWLITLDDYISDENVDLMAAGRITLYVPDRVFQRLKERKGHLRSLKTLIADLEPIGGS